MLASERRLSLQMYSRLCETMQQPRNSCLIAYKNFPRFSQDSPVFVDKRRYNGGSCLHVQAHNQIFPSNLYNRSWFPSRIGGLSACMGNVVHSTYTTGTCALPAALGLVRTYQAKHSSLWYKCNMGHTSFTARMLLSIFHAFLI